MNAMANIGSPAPDVYDFL